MTPEELLPGWVTWAPWLWAPVFALVGYACVALLLRLAKLPAEPWTERAREAHRIRMLASVARILLFGGATFFGVFLSADHLGRALFIGLAGFVGTLWPALRFEDRLAGRSGWRPGLRSYFSRMALALGIIPPLVAPVLVMRSEPSERFAVEALAGLVVLVTMLGGNVALVRLLGLARPAPPRVRAAVERAAARLNIRCRSVLELDWLAANALAFPLTRDIAFTRPMEAMMSDEELEAVAAHELGHLAEPLRIKLSRPLVVVVLYTALVVFFEVGDFGFRGLLSLLVAVLVLLVVIRRTLHSGEQHADATAHDDGKVYGRALERLYAYNLVPAVLRRPGAHGHLYDRLVAAGYTPPWPRPAPPARAPLGGRVLAACVAVGPVAWLLSWSPMPQTVDDALRTLALYPRAGWAYERLAREEMKQGQPQRALVYYHSAVELLPDEPFLRAASVGPLIQLGMCPDAKVQLEAGRALLVRRAYADGAAALDAEQEAFDRYCPEP